MVEQGTLEIPIGLNPDRGFNSRPLRHLPPLPHDVTRPVASYGEYDADYATQDYRVRAYVRKVGHGYRSYALSFETPPHIIAEPVAELLVPGHAKESAQEAHRFAQSLMRSLDRP